MSTSLRCVHISIFTWHHFRCAVTTYNQVVQHILSSQVQVCFFSFPSFLLVTHSQKGDTLNQIFGLKRQAGRAILTDHNHKRRSSDPSVRWWQVYPPLTQPDSSLWSGQSWTLLHCLVPWMQEPSPHWNSSGRHVSRAVGGTRAKRTLKTGVGENCIFKLYSFILPVYACQFCRTRLFLKRKNIIHQLIALSKQTCTAPLQIDYHRLQQTSTSRFLVLPEELIPTQPSDCGQISLWSERILQLCSELRSPLRGE